MVDDVKIEKDVSGFYDSIASDYDAMTGFEKRFITERPFFRLLVERRHITTALDAGAGTGFHSLLLAQLGVHVTAVDISRAMLEKVSRHAKRLNLPIKTVEAGFQNLSRTLNKQYDAVFCLGNSLPHLLSDDEVQAALSNFASLLNPGGSLFLQILNYDRILKHQERVQSVKEAGNTTFIRFYDFEKEFLRFNILKLEKKDDTISQTLNSIQLRPLRTADLETLLRQSGFAEVSFFGGISLEPFVPEASRDLVIVAAKD